MIHFITPLYRYSNIKIIYSSIKHQIKDFKWHLIEGSNRIDNDSLDFLLEDKRVFFYKIQTNYRWGHEQRNYFITNIPADDEDWCYFLDDDNVITPDLVKSLNDDADLIVFRQLAGLTDIVRLWGGENGLGLGRNDIGNFIVRYKILKQTIIPNADQRNSDGHFGDTLKEFKNKYKFIYYDDRYCRYNSLSLEII